jgi:AcrR family transcriptional regulator
MSAPAVAPRLAATTPTLPPGVLGEGARARILTAALSLFAQRGFYGTSIRDIAAAAGLQSASLYGHFPSKEQLLAEIVAVGHEEHHRRLRAALLDGGSDPVDQLRAFVRAHVLMHAEHPVLTMVSNNELHVLPPELATRALAFRQQSELLMVELVERGIALGRFAPPHPWMTAAAVLGMGIRVGNWFDPTLGLAPDEVADTYSELALRMMGVLEAPEAAAAATPSVTTDELVAKRGLR